MKSILSFSIILCLVPSAFAAVEEGDAREATGAYVPEPSTMRSEALGQLFRSSPLLQRFRLAAVGSWKVGVGRTYSNFWGHDKRYIVDLETRDDQVRVDYQPLTSFAFYGAAAERALTRMGTDGMAIGFHNIFGLPQDGRLTAPRNDVRLSIPDFDLNYTLAQKNEIISRQFELGALWDVARAWGLELPTTLALFANHEFAGDNPYFTGATDVGGRLSLSLPLGPWNTFGSLSFVRFDPRQETALSTYRQQWGGVLGEAFRFNASHEVLTQFLVHQPLFRDMGQLSRSSYEIHLSYRRNWQRVSLEAGLIENIFWVYNSPDWGFSGALTYRPGTD